MIVYNYKIYKNIISIFIMMFLFFISFDYAFSENITNELYLSLKGQYGCIAKFDYKYEIFKNEKNYSINLKSRLGSKSIEIGDDVISAILDKVNHISWNDISNDIGKENTTADFNGTLIIKNKCKDDIILDRKNNIIIGKIDNSDIKDLIKYLMALLESKDRLSIV